MGKRLHGCYLLAILLGAPLLALYDWVPFFLSKQLGASPLQLAIVFSAKPTAALLSFYWSSWVAQRGGSLKKQVIGAISLGALSALFYWRGGMGWSLILGFAAYAVCHRALIPPWMEILKANLPKESRSRLFARGALITYIIGLFLPLLIGRCMEHNGQFWRIAFLIAGVLALCGALVQFWLPHQSSKAAVKQGESLLARPWIDCWNLMRARPDFALYQGIFLCGGLGLMMMQPSLPVFMTEQLDITWTEIAVAISACRAVGFLIMNRFWARWINRIDIYRLSALVALIAALFPIVVLGSVWHIAIVGVAYLVYGGMKAGSDLAWHMSGPIFSGSDSSLHYSSVNIVLVGLRGLIGPFVGGLLLAQAGPTTALLCGSAVCFTGFLYGTVLSRRVAHVSAPS